jgi:outer membrane receptor protein involved in Fe transport
LLGRVDSAVGVDVQRRTPIVADPRIRAYHVGQVFTLSDGGFFLPARLDLDTAVSKYDSSIIRDVIVLKGPYTMLYGPGFAFLDVATNDTPRYDHLEYHGRTSFGWQSNGDRLNAMQALWGGSSEWGFRISYGFFVGSDYEAGNGQIVPSSYNSQPINYAVGVNLSPDNKLEFKGLHLDQRNVEFPALYFDIRHLTTDAMSLRWTVTNQEFFDRFNVDLWYNRTEANGDTQQGAKQIFLNTFLSESAIPFVHDPIGVATINAQLAANPNALISNILHDQSTTAFNEMSRGYRILMTWGQNNCPQLTIGTDLNYVNQALFENIMYLQLIDNPLNVAVPAPLPPGAPGPTGFQNPGIPPSHLVDPGVFAEVSVPVGNRLNIKSGIRGDWVNTKSDPRLVSGNIPIIFGPNNVQTNFDPIILSSAPNDDNLDRNFPLWAAYMTADYKIDEHLTVLGGTGFAQRAPTLTELYATSPYISVLQQGLDRLYGDPNLSPERALQVDIGLKANYNCFRASVAGFYSWIHDYITYDANNFAGSPLSKIAQVIYTNTDQATLAGGELVAEMDATDYLTPFGTLSYVQGRDLTHIDTRRPPDVASSRRTIDQEPLPGIPPLEARAGIRFHERGRSPKWAIELALRMVDEQNLVAASLGEVPTPGFTTFDVRAYWQATKAILLIAGVENITDKFYREHLDPRSGFPGDELFRPGTNFYMGMTVQY